MNDTNEAEREKKFIAYNRTLDELREVFMERWKTKKEDNVNLDDFERFRTVGTGAFGRVMVVKYKPASTYHAMKILSKGKLVKLKQVDHTRNEKRILQCLNFPFTVFMDYFFKVRSDD
jgi:protein kinase A